MVRPRALNWLTPPPPADGRLDRGNLRHVEAVRTNLEGGWGCGTERLQHPLIWFLHPWHQWYVERPYPYAARLQQHCAIRQPGTAIPHSNVLQLRLSHMTTP